MKLTFVFLVATGIIFHLKFSEPKQSLMAQAIHQVIEEHYVKNSVKFEIFYNSNELDVMSKTLKLIKELKDYRITKVNDNDKNNITLLHSGIFILDTKESFKKLMSRIKVAANGPKEVNMLIYCQALTTRALALAEVTKIAIQTFSFLLEEKNEIIIKAYALFTPKRCRSNKLIDVNKFSRKSMKWSGPTFFQTMIRDFHGCPLYFGVHGTEIHDYIPNSELFYALASHLNFKVELVKMKPNSSVNEWDHHFSSLDQIDYDSFYRFDFTVPLYSTPYVFVVPPGAPYTPIETFFLPFDLETWILFAIVFILAFSVVVIVKLSRSRSLRVLIVGENVSMPGLNIFGIFMGIGMMTLPRRNISRILLMNFILFSLIMRTAFQGKYFEFMTGDVHKRPIQTFAELIEKNFTLYVWDSRHYKRNKNKDDLGRLNYGGGMEMIKKAYKNLHYPNFKGCILDESRNIAMYEKAMKSLIKFNVLQKEFGSFNIGIYFNSRFMSPIFRLKIEQLVTGGVWEKIESWEKHVFKLPATRRPQPKPYDTVLTLKHLSIGFYIWLLMILLSSLAFTGEMLKYWAPKVARMLFFHYVMSRFYKIQRSMH